MNSAKIDLPYENRLLMEDQLLIEDQLSRELIEKDTATNYFIEASAGSGKTTSLVGRMTTMVQNGIPVEKICAITFTKAAAGEFYHRFQRKLAECCADGTLSEEKRVRCAEALRNIDLSFAGTIDSFCYMLLREHPDIAQIPPDAAILSGDELKNIYRREYYRAARGEYGEELKRKYIRFTQAQSYAEEVFLSYIETFLDSRNAKLVFLKPEDILFSSSTRDKIIRMLDCLVHSERLVDTVSKKDSATQYAALKKDHRILGRDWIENLSSIIYLLKGISKDLRVVNNPDEKFYSDYSDYLVPKYRGKSTELMYYNIEIGTGNSLLNSLMELQHSITLDFINSFVGAVSSRLKSEGTLSYFDCLLYLRDMLRSDAEAGGTLIRHIAGRHSYYLIDEFQDTNPMQAEIFFYLASDVPKADWRECVPRPGSLFIVGDPKQSIYRFNNADVASFLRVKNLFAEKCGKVLRLHLNFRSADPLRRYFNRTFADLLPEQGGEQATYQSPFHAIPEPTERKGGEPGTLCGAYRFRTDSSKAGDNAVLVASIIEQIVGNEQYTIRDGSGSTRPVRHGDIMIITPNKPNLHIYSTELKRRGIPSYVNGSTSFGSCQCLKAASEVIGALAFPGESSKVFSALTGSAFGLSEADISSYILDGHALNLYGSDELPDEADAVSRALYALGLLRMETGSLTAAALLLSVVDRLDLYSVCGSDNLEYLHYAAELLREAETGGSISSAADTADYLSDLLSSRAEERCMRFEPDGDRVFLANLHKVKGLEAPVVILADPGNRTHSVNTHIETGSEPPEMYCFLLNKKDPIKRSVYSQSTDHSELKELEERILAAERTRLLYVAATRARDALIITDLISTKTDNAGISSDNNRWFPLLNDDVHALPLCDGDDTAPADNSCEASALPSAEDLLRGSDQSGIFSDRAPEQSSYSVRRPSQIRLKGRSSSEDELPERSESGELEKYLSDVPARHATTLGTMVHRLMEGLVSSGGSIDTDRFAQTMTEEYGLFGSDGEKLVDAVKKVGRKMLSGGYPQTNGLPDDLLCELRSADKVMCEVPFCLRTVIGDAPAITHGIMDLVYLKDGMWHIVDYKTSENVGNLDAHYEDQLRDYREAFRQITGFEADARTYHIATRRTRNSKVQEG